jgi:hypothetical protein
VKGFKGWRNEGRGHSAAEIFLKKYRTSLRLRKMEMGMRELAEE